MSCPKNPKKFLSFVPYNGPCEFQDSYIKAAGQRGMFVVDLECKHCKSEDITFRTAQNMIRVGYDVQKLNVMSWYDMLGKRPEDLK